MPEFENSIDVQTWGTYLIGTVETRYDTLVRVFGEPVMYDGIDEKTTCQWNLEFEDGSVATIYDWKTEQTPLEAYEWHVGGKSPEALTNVLDTLNEALEGAPSE